MCDTFLYYFPANVISFTNAELENGDKLTTLAFYYFLDSKDQIWKILWS